MILQSNNLINTTGLVGHFALSVFLFMDIITLLILSLACWRITSLLVNEFEQGPYQILTKFRERAMEYTDVFECIYCTSIWIGLILTIGYFFDPAITPILCLPFALSGLTLVWDKWNG